MPQRTTIIIVLTALVATTTALLGSSLAARESSAARESAEETKIGFLIPSQCQPREGAKRPDGPYDEWPAPHTTKCALRDACIASGYGLWVMDEKTFYRFDAAGHDLALEYFRTTQRTSYNKVEIVGDFTDIAAVRIIEMTPTD